jgi:hypothetical protein
MSHRDDRATELAVLRCERAVAMRSDFRWSEEYRLYYQQTMAGIAAMRHRPGLATQLRRRMAKIKPVEPPVANDATEAVGTAKEAQG